MNGGENDFKNAIEGKKLPILTLDNKWHRLFTQIEEDSEISALEKELNDLLKEQGKVNTKTKDLKKLKTKLMDEIVSMMNEDDSNDKIEENRRMIEECNQKIDELQDENMDLPKAISDANKKLMLATMAVCYEDISESTKEINEIGEWIDSMRVELKKNVIRKQEKQKRIQDLYSYMHDIFGSDVIEIFDMKYNPEENALHKG